jgi:intein/homing endonuclease
MVFYPNPVNVGLDAVRSLGDGHTITIRWFRALPKAKTNKIAYNIYYATVKENVFTEGRKFVSIDDAVETNITDLTPGQEYFFSVRPIEYDPLLYNLSLLPIAHDNLRFYPQSLLRQDISATDLSIPLLDVDGFPNTGVIKIGPELILYTAIDTLNKNLIVAGGTSSQNAKLVDQGGGNFYLPLGTNIGMGQINGLILLNPNAPTETWTIRCIWVQRDGLNNPIAGTAKFIAIGSISGDVLDGYGEPFVWIADDQVISNGILSFSISETSPAFREGDGFTVKVAGAIVGSNGRGFDNSKISLHTVSGFDGYFYWDPTVVLWTDEEEELFDRIFACQSRFEYPNYAFNLIDGYHQVPKDLLSSDLDAADAANVTFPMFDFSGFHRTDPVQLLNGTCVGSYIGGEQGCIDGYGNFNILRGLSVQDQNTQRQDVLLSVTGRPVVLVKRVQTGITCACYLASSEYPDDRCPKCFVPGTLVRTKNGLKPIETIKIGDLVLTMDGTYQPVVRIFENPFDGMLQSITTTTTAEPILATPEHPFLVLRGSHQEKNDCGPNSNCKAYIARGDHHNYGGSIDILPSGKYHARITTLDHVRKVLGTFDTEELALFAIDEYKNANFKRGHTLEWEDAKNIVDGDWLVSKWSNEVHDIDSVQVPSQFRKHTKLGKQRLGTNEFIVDEDFMWMIGMYLAEGSHSKRTINFSLHEKETEYAGRLVKYFSQYGYHPVIYKSKISKGITVNVHSTALARWFPDWLGTKCYNKHVPEELMNLPKEKTWALINGVYDGDGFEREHEIMQTSRELALQLVELLHRVGEQPLLRSVKNKRLTPKGNQRKIAYAVNWAEDTATHHNRKGRWDLRGEALTKIRKVDEQYYSGPVYNLEVSGNHTYVVQNIVVHNCHGTKFVVGYEQYFNPRRSDGRILVRPGPTAENLRMREAGLESEFPVDFWTLTVPTIKTRDFLVEFDQDDNETFRYEISDVIRNDTILGLDAAQHLKTFRVRKFDPIYQVPVFRNTAMFPMIINTGIGFTTGIPPHTHTIHRNETDPSKWSQLTSLSQGHNHDVLYNSNTGQLTVIEVLGHTHQIIIM